MNLSDRIRRLESSVAMSAVNELTDRESKQLARWPELVLERYCEGRLDELASAFEPLRKLLHALLEDGFAIQSGGNWHPLYTIGDQWLDLRVLNRLKTMLNGEMT